MFVNAEKGVASWDICIVYVKPRATVAEVICRWCAMASCCSGMVQYGVPRRSVVGRAHTIRILHTADSLLGTVSIFTSTLMTLRHNVSSSVNDVDSVNDKFSRCCTMSKQWNAWMQELWLSSTCNTDRLAVYNVLYWQCRQLGMRPRLVTDSRFTMADHVASVCRQAYTTLCPEKKWTP